MSDQRTAFHPASLARALRNGFRAAYDHLGYVVFVSLGSFIMFVGIQSLVALAVGHGLGSVWFITLAPGALFVYLFAVGVYYYVNKIVFHEHPVVADMWVGIKRLVRPALGMFVVDFVITAVLVGDTVFFAMMSRRELAMLAPAFLCFYLTLVWMMMTMYHLPLLIAQEKMESGPRAWLILRKSFLLMADNPGFTVGLFLVIIAFAVVCAIPVLIGIALLGLGATAFVLTHTLRELFTKYGIVEEESELVEDGPWSLPESWRRRDARDDTVHEEMKGTEQHG
ncbi:MAG: hypothetical protein M1133_08660 [Armatimonadetes bacterium]|nr:hypothetical protein [Armatimonadota bacterium]